jgi:putative tryptophan/tyrosine transport system substrate-binding protein
MNRRDFITLLGGAVLPGAALAQQPMPVVGFLNSLSPEVWMPFVAAFRQGLSEGGFDDGRNVAIEYRWAQNRTERLPGMVAELVQRPVSVIVATGGDYSVQAAKAATTTIPVVATFAFDPVEAGFVTSMNRPGSNITGVSLFSTALVAKRVEMLHDISPNTATIGFLTNSQSPSAKADARIAGAAAQSVGQKMIVASAAAEPDCETAFDSLKRQGAGAILIQSDPFFNSVAAQLVALARRYSLAVMYGRREYATDGGLISYGSRLANSYRQLGDYTARILKGAKAADLPILQPTAFELVVNLKSAKEIGLTVPTSLLLRADEVIE